MFRLFIIPESLPYFFSRGNPGTAVVIILNDDGKKFLLKTIEMQKWFNYVSGIKKN